MNGVRRWRFTRNTLNQHTFSLTYTSRCRERINRTRIDRNKGKREESSEQEETSAPHLSALHRSCLDSVSFIPSSFLLPKFCCSVSWLMSNTNHPRSSERTYWTIAQVLIIYPLEQLHFTTKFLIRSECTVLPIWPTFNNFYPFTSLFNWPILPPSLLSFPNKQGKIPGKLRAHSSLLTFLLHIHGINGE